jgi:hypothetical protein
VETQGLVAHRRKVRLLGNVVWRRVGPKCVQLSAQSVENRRMASEP